MIWCRIGKFNTPACKIVCGSPELPDFAFIRELLEREPGLNAKEIAPRLVRSSFPADDDEDEEHAQQSLL